MWGYAHTQDVGAKSLSSWDDLSAAYTTPHTLVWVDLENPTPDDLARLDAIIDLDDDALEECLTGEPRPRIDEWEDYLMIVAYGVILPEGSVELESRKLAIFRGDRFLVTIHSQPSRSVVALRERCEKNAERVLSQGVDRLVFRLIDGMVGRYLSLLDGYEREVEEFEDRSFDPAADGDLLHDASRIRRHLIEIRRLVGAQQGLIEPLAEGDYDYVADELSQRFRTVRSHMLHAFDRVAGLQERLSAAIQNYHATVSLRTNDVMRTLTVLTAVVLPMSLIAGVYGMNVHTWPSQENSASFWLLLALMGVVGGASFGVFRWLRWL